MIVVTVSPTGNRQGGSKAHASKLTLTANTQILKKKVLNLLYMARFKDIIHCSEEHTVYDSSTCLNLILNIEARDSCTCKHNKKMMCNV